MSKVASLPASTSAAQGPVSPEKLPLPSDPFLAHGRRLTLFSSLRDLPEPDQSIELDARPVQSAYWSNQNYRAFAESGRRQSLSLKPTDDSRQKR